MSSGILTEQEKLLLQERTSLFVNVAGSLIQRLKGAGEVGLSKIVYFKVLANTVWDWHFLADRGHTTRKLLGVGDLRWVPHRFGSIMQVVPQLRYKDIEYWYGFFPTFLELFTSKLYSQYGFQGIVKNNGEHRFLFAKQPISLEVIRKQPITEDEWYCWKEIVSCYARQSTDTLNAMASCRNETAMIHSLWFQYVIWRAHIGTLMTRLRDKESEIARGMAGERLAAAKECVRQLRLKRRYFDEREFHIEKIREAAAYTEFGGTIPFVDEGIGWTDKLADKIEALTGSIPALEGMLDLANSLSVHLGVLESNGNTIPIEQSLSQIALAIKKNTNTLNSYLWNTIWLAREPKEAANTFIQLVDEVYGVLTESSGLEFLRAPDHYARFFREYPLPVSHFVPGY